MMPFKDDAERVAFLFEMYKKIIKQLRKKKSYLLREKN